MIFTLFRKRAVNIQPLLTQAENRLDITDTLSSLNYQKIIPSRIILHTARVRDIYNTQGFPKYIYIFYLAKRLLILDCLNRSLKGLLINHRGDVDILLFPLSNVCQVMYACNSIEYRQKINTKLPCLYSPTLYFADFCISVFQNGQCKVSNRLKDFKFDFIYSFSFPLDSPSLEKGMWFMHRVLAITTVSNSRKTVFLQTFFFTGGEAI